MASSLFECKRAPAFSFSMIFYKMPTLENSQPVFIPTGFQNRNAARTRLSVDRAVDRPLPPVDRSVDRVPNRELGTYSQAFRSTARSTDPIHRSTARSTGCPTETWAITVRQCGRPDGRPLSDPVHVVHVRSTGPVDR